MSISEYLLSRGWNWYAEGFIDPFRDRYVDLSGDGAVWELKGYSHGAADPQWIRFAQGDSLAQLKELV